jgi:phosphoglycolate phosphatase-like HAD superfamily hydrolase
MPEIAYAKPEPDLFIAAAEPLGIQIESAVVIGDSIWDMLAARQCSALGVGWLIFAAATASRAPGNRCCCVRRQGAEGSRSD